MANQPFNARQGLSVGPQINVIDSTGNISANNITAANVTGTLTTASQPYITGLGTLVNLNVAGNLSSGNLSTGNFTSQNLSGNGAGLANLNAANLVSGTVPSNRLVGTYTINITGNASGSANTVTYPVQSNITQVGTLSDLSVSGVAYTGELRSYNNVIAYYSDERLKTRLGPIENALDKICALEGFYFEANERAQALGYIPQRDVGVSAQKTQQHMPEIVTTAPRDDQYLTVKYDKFAPYLIEAIKQLRAEVAELRRQLGK